MNINTKTFVLTGAGSGIGRALALELIRQGARVAGADLRSNTLAETKRLIPPEQQERFSMHEINIADKAAVEAFPEQVLSAHGAIDGVINNAGIIQPFVNVNDLDYASIEKVFDVDFFGTLYMTKAFLPHLLQRPEAYLVNVSSMGGFLPVPGQSIYGAAKAGVKLMTEGLYAELQGTPVHVSIVFPGAIATNITKNSDVAMPAGAEEAAKKFKALPADTAAQIIVRGIQKNKPRIIVGQDSRTMDLLYRLNPTFATNFIARQMKSLLR